MRRRMMLKTQVRYVPVEYIESSGTQYIDTGVVPDDTTGFYVDAQKQLNDNSDAVIIGARTGTARCWLNIDHSNAGRGNVSIGWINYTAGTEAGAEFIGLDRFKISVNLNNSRVCLIDDVEFANGTNLLKSTLSTQSYPFYLFGANDKGTFNIAGSYKCYAVKISKNNTIIRNFIPVKDIINNVYGMFDTVTEKFYGNAGTGAFTAGPEIKRVDYIQSDGYQYIDVGTNFDFGMEYQFKYDADVTQIRSTSGKWLIFGTNASNNEVMVGYKSGLSGSLVSNYLGGGTSSYDNTTTLKEVYLRIKSGDYLLKINGVDSIISTSTTRPPMYFKNAYVFASYGTTTATDVDSFVVGKFYYFKAWQNDVLVRDFIPILLGTEYAMLDLVEWKIYRNAGTGAFTGGPDLLDDYDLLTRLY